MNPKPFRVIPCAEWKAKPPKHPIPVVMKKPDKGLFHHTAGHVPNLAKGETYAEACAYARAIQKMHMAPGGLGAPEGGVDSGHNFLITRGGFILEGRHGSIGAIRSGKMVESAHCPGQNDQPGVEHEHNGTEQMTPLEREASVWLYTWIFRHCVIPATHIYGHRDFYATDCPGVLYAQLPSLRQDVAAALKPPKPKPVPQPPSPHGYWIVTKTFYDGHLGPAEKVKSLRLWSLKQGNLVKKGVRHIDWHWVETG